MAVWPRVLLVLHRGSHRPAISDVLAALMSFTLTPTRPKTHDPNLIPKTADPSWFDTAEVAWIDAQCFAYDVRDARERLAEVRARIENGKKWLAEHKEAIDDDAAI